MVELLEDISARLNEVITRLTDENAQHRRRIEELQITIRHRAPNVDGLTLKGALEAILDDRDSHIARAESLEEQLKKVLRLILDHQASKAAKMINSFLIKDREEKRNKK